MDTPREKMNASLKQFVVPRLKEHGFKGSLPNFNRITESEIHLIVFQFDRNGGGFVIEIANCKNELFHSHLGKTIDPKNLKAHDLLKRIRIYRKGLLEVENGVDSWFRYDKTSLFGNKYSRVAKQVLNQIDLIEECFKKANLGLSK